MPKEVVINKRLLRETRNRAYADDRPDKKSLLRENPITNEQHPCYLSGHQTRFYRGDNYGCCVRCGNEMLT